MLRISSKNVWNKTKAKTASFCTLTPSQVSSYIASVRKQLYLHSPSDWDQVPSSHLKLSPAGAKLLKQFGSVAGVAAAAYPLQEWPEGSSHQSQPQNQHQQSQSQNQNQYSPHQQYQYQQHSQHQYQQHHSPHSKFAPQTYMARVIRFLFPDEPLSYNVRNLFTTSKSSKSSKSSRTSKVPLADGDISGKSPNEVTKTRRAPLEIDVYLPNLKLGFEYQDPHHYFHSTFGSSTLQEYQERDIQKKEFAEKSGITLISVPFWWDWNHLSLAASIKEKRGELLAHIDTQGIKPLDHAPPPHIVNKWNYDIPDLGAPMLALYVPQTKSFDPSSWWAFEKYDGIRGIWHPQNRILYSRWGTPLRLPNYINDIFPGSFWLDGEIWFGRDRDGRQKATKISFSPSLSSVEWDKFRFVVFDSPAPKGDLPYHVRYNLLQNNFPRDLEYTFLAPYEVCSGKDALEQIFFKIRANNGEGIILRDSLAPYVSGYSRSLYKHRGFNDAEALILEMKSDSRFICRVAKSHLVHNASQSQSEVEGSEHDEQIPEKNLVIMDDQEFYDIEMGIDENTIHADRNELVPGVFVSFKYSGNLHARGPPINPKIYCLREDVKEWGQILSQKTKPLVHQSIWKPFSVLNDWKTVENRRKFFDELAKTKGLDALNPDHWYKAASSLRNVKGISGILEYYNGSVVDALMDIYAEIGLKAHLFHTVPKNYWANREHRKKFFDDFANVNDFDPKEKTNWYLNQSAVLEAKGYSGIRHYYKGSLSAALMDIYPDIGFEKSEFKSFPRKHWSKGKNVKNLFLQFAKEKGFNPTEGKNWPKYEDLLVSDKRFDTLAKYTTPVHALFSAFPNVGLNPHQFKSLLRDYWDDGSNQKQFFLDFAHKKNFNAFEADNWYTRRGYLRNLRGYSDICKRYGTVDKALISLFPNIGLDSGRLNVG